MFFTAIFSLYLSNNLPGSAQHSAVCGTVRNDSQTHSEVQGHSWKRIHEIRVCQELVGDLHLCLQSSGVLHHHQVHQAAQIQQEDAATRRDSETLRQESGSLLNRVWNRLLLVCAVFPHYLIARYAAVCHLLEVVDDELCYDVGKV